MSDEAKIILTLLAVLLVAIGALLVGLLYQAFLRIGAIQPHSGDGKTH